MLYEKEIFEELGLFPLVAGEVEFYIEPAPKRSSTEEDIFLKKILDAFEGSNVKLYRLDKETTVGQYEFSLTPQPPRIAADEIVWAKELISQISLESNLKSIFAAKPYANRAGCGMHIHISFLNKKGESVLKRVDDNNESETMLHAIGGLCSTMIKNFTSFAPFENSYLRFTSAKNNFDPSLPMSAYNNAPVNVSWGGNNRTTAIRIPASTIDESMRHIEHRVSGADANPEHVIEKILEGVYLGLKESINPLEKIFGNAYDKQYSYLTPFPKSLPEAIELSSQYKN